MDVDVEHEKIQMTQFTLDYSIQKGESRYDREKKVHSKGESCVWIVFRIDN